MEDELKIHVLFERGDMQAAATAAIDRYGPEVLGFLMSLLGDDRAGREVFSETCDNLWTSLAHFQWRCSMRTWFYGLARRAARRFQRAHRAQNGLPVRAFRGTQAIDYVVAPKADCHFQINVEDRLRAIREALGTNDRALLMLRLDRGLAWEEIARIFSHGDASDETLRRVAIGLRKRFQGVRIKIRALACEAGLLSNGPCS